VDYKWSPPRQLRLDRAYYGLDLQLLTYLAVLAEHGRRIANQPVEPAGAFFATLLDQVQRLDAPPQEPPEEADRYRPLRPRGVFDLEGLRAFDSDFGPGSSSKVIAARLNKDGSPGLLNQTDAAGHEAFLALLDHIRRKIGELCDRMLNGEVAVRPYRMGQTTPCTWCPYGSVCRIELVWFSANVLHRMKRLEVFNLLCPGSGEASDGE
jgi:ATP-dependent helicase/nuclease subunit B